MLSNGIRSSAQVLAITTLMLLLWGCDIQETLSPAKPESLMSHLLFGRVLDHQTHRALAGVQLYIPGMGDVVTDQEGVYTVDQRVFPTLTMSSITITAEKAGYHSAAVVVRPDSGEVSIPTLLLRRVAPTVLIGPEGGVLQSEGVQVRIPAGALAAAVPLSVATKNARATMGSDSKTFRETVEIDLRPYGLRFARPVEITVLLPTLHIVNSRLPLLRKHNGTERLDSVGMAVVGDDGHSAKFSLDAIATNESVITSEPFYERKGPFIRPETIATALGVCGSGGSHPTRVVDRPADISVPDYQHPQFSSDALKQFINAIPATVSQTRVTIEDGQAYRFVIRKFKDYYTGTETGKFWDSWNRVNVNEPIQFSYNRVGYEYRKSACHLQGGS